MLLWFLQCCGSYVLPNIILILEWNMEKNRLFSKWGRFLKGLRENLFEVDWYFYQGWPKFIATICSDYGTQGGAVNWRRNEIWRCHFILLFNWTRRRSNGILLVRFIFSTANGAVHLFMFHWRKFPTYSAFSSFSAAYRYSLNRRIGCCVYDVSLSVSN